MIRKFQIDQLLLFLVLSLALLLLLFGSSLIHPRDNNRANYGKVILAENVIGFPTSGLLKDQNEVIEVFDPQMELWYSINGGQSFEKAEDHLNITDLDNPDLSLIPTSFHWKTPLDKSPAGKSLVIKANNANRTGSTPEKVLNYFEEVHNGALVVAITTPQENLFSDEKGIMVFGEDAYHQNGFYKNWWERAGNFQDRGMSSERAVNVQFFENGEFIYEQNCGIRISGNATRGFPQKSLQLISRKLYGKTHFELEPFGNEGLNKYESFVLRNSGNDNTHTMFADLMMQNLVLSKNIFTQKGRPAILYLNGNYWGLYNLRERIDQYVIAEYEDVKPDKVTILENGNGLLKDGSESVQTEFLAMIEILRSEVSADDKMNAIEESIDLRSFTDYIIFECFYANGDWPSNNATWYKADDKKWKWILNDLDYGMAYHGDENLNANTFERLKKMKGIVPELFRFLIDQPTFKSEFKYRAQELVAGCFNSLRVSEIFNEHVEQYRPHMQDHINRWRMIDSLKAWEEYCLANLDFLLKRPDIFLKQIEAL